MGRKRTEVRSQKSEVSSQDASAEALAARIREKQIAIICRRAGVSREELPGLTTLYAQDNSGITDAGLAHVPNLTTLDAWGNSGITDAGLAHVPNLTTLYAWGNSGITDAGKQLVRDRAAAKKS